MSKENLEAACIFGNEAAKVLENKAYQFATTAIKGQIFDKLTNTYWAQKYYHTVE